MVGNEEAKTNEGPAGDNPEEFSLEDLDKVLAEADPEFAQSLDAIKADFVDAAQHVVDLEIKSDDGDGKEPDEEVLNLRQKIIRKLTQPIKKPIEKIDHFLRPKMRAAKNMSILLFQQSVAFLKNELPDRIRYVKAQAKGLLAVFVAWIVFFKKQTFVRKLASVAILFICVGSIYFVSRIFVPKWLPRFSIHLLQSWKDEGELIGAVKDRSDLMNFFEAFPETEFHVRLSKIIVNFRRLENSNSNPMGLFEFYLGLDSRETAIEVKDREKEIIDLVQRSLEDFTYAEVMAYNGKIRMKAALKENINALLNQGAVNRIYINRMVTNN
jgi:hypothetical protein